MEYNKQRTIEDEDNYQDDEVSQKLPLKNHINRLDFHLKEANNDLEQSKKHKQQIRLDIVASSQVNQDIMQDLNNFIYNETKRLQMELEEQNLLQSEQYSFLKQQTDSINQDRIKLQQNAIVLSNKIEEAEKEFGFL